ALRVVRVRREGDVLDGLGAVWRALDRELAGLVDEIFGRGLQQVRGELARLVENLARSDRGRGPGHRGRAARVGAEGVGRRVRIALLDLDVLRGNAQLLGQDLRVRRLVALALRLGAEARDGLAGGMDADLAAVEHLETEDVEVLRWAGAHNLREARNADAHQLAALALLLLLAAQLGVADRVHRLPKGARIVAAVVFP